MLYRLPATFLTIGPLAAASNRATLASINFNFHSAERILILPQNIRPHATAGINLKLQSETLSQLLRETGFCYFCGFVVADPAQFGFAFARTYIDNFIQSYGLFGASIRRDIEFFCRAKKPCITRMIHSSTPNFWVASNDCDDREEQIFRVPAKYGFHKYSYAIAFPCHGRRRRQVLLAFSDGAVLPENVHEAFECISRWHKNMPIISNYHFVGTQEKTKSKVPKAELDEVEIECLKWVAAGKTLQDIAQITGKSYKSVRYHLDKARDKYGFSSAHQTLVQATRDYSLSPFGEP